MHCEAPSVGIFLAAAYSQRGSAFYQLWTATGEFIVHLASTPVHSPRAHRVGPQLGLNLPVQRAGASLQFGLVGEEA